MESQASRSLSRMMFSISVVRKSGPSL